MSDGYEDAIRRWANHAATLSASIERLTRERDAAQLLSQMREVAVEGYRTERDEARAELAKAREALKPFVLIANANEDEPPGASVFVNISRCREARAAFPPKLEPQP
jgi:hypothetical protein